MPSWSGFKVFGQLIQAQVAKFTFMYAELDISNSVISISFVTVCNPATNSISDTDLCYVMEKVVSKGQGWSERAFDLLVFSFPN